MTSVRCFDGEKSYSVEADGHATGAPDVCAGVSALLFAVLGTMNNAPNIRTVRCCVSEGHVCLEWEKGGEAAETLFTVACIGLRQIEMAKPEYITVNIF